MPPPLRNAHPRLRRATAPVVAAVLAALTLVVSTTWLAWSVLCSPWLEVFPAALWFYPQNNRRPKPKREKVVVNRPVLRIHSLHSCWAHALLDSLPPVFAAAEALRGRDWTLVFGRDMFDGLPENEAMLTNGTDGGPVRYKGGWGEMIEALNATDALFEHLVEPVFNVTVVDVDYGHRMSIWDSNETYPGRPPRNGTDAGVPFGVRVGPYKTMVRRVLDHVQLPKNGNGGGTRGGRGKGRRQRVLLVDREGGDRRFLPYILSDLVAVLEEGSAENNPNATINFDGVQNFAGLSLREQLERVQSADVMVLRHGSAEAWGAFLRPGTVLFEVNSHSEMQDGDMRPRMYDQVCRVSGCQHINVEEDNAAKELCSVFNMNGTACNEIATRDEWGYPTDYEMMDDMIDRWNESEQMDEEMFRR